MNKIEKLHLEVIENNFNNTSKLLYQGIKDAASESAEITEQIAIEFANYLNIKYRDLTHTLAYNNMSIKELFQEFSITDKT